MHLVNMNGMAYSREELKAYLLGSIDEVKAERFDELSIVDDAFVEELSAAEYDLIDFYNDGDLTAEDRDLFERKYLNSGSGRSKLRFARSLQHFGTTRSMNSHSAGQFEPADRVATDSILVAALRSLRWAFAVAGAAVLLAAVWLFYPESRIGDPAGELAANTDSLRSDEGDSPREPADNSSIPSNEVASENKDLPIDKPKGRNDLPQNAKSAKPPKQQIGDVLAFALSPQLRSAGQLPKINIPPNTERISATLTLEPNDFDAFRVLLSEQATGRIVWRSGTMHPTSSGLRITINPTAPANLIGSGIYSFTVFAVSRGSDREILGDYRFRVVR